MSSQGRSENATQATPVYTVYPVSGGNAGNINYGFHQNNPNIPPPKYEEVVGGIPNAPVPPPQSGGTYDLQGQPNVIYVAPLYKTKSFQRTFSVIFGVVFLIVFFTILSKMFSV